MYVCVYKWEVFFMYICIHLQNQPIDISVCNHWLTTQREDRSMRIDNH